MTRRPSALLVAVLLTAPLAACSDDGPGEGEAHLEVDGLATVTRADGDSEDVDGEADLSPGDRVEVKDGVARMELEGGTTFELRAGLDPDVDDNTTVLMADRPVLEAGDLLVTTTETAELEADGTEVDVIDGAARVSRAFGMSVSAYDADVELDSAGATAAVPALRRLAVPDLGQVPSDLRPVSYDDADPDPWDRRYLGAAIDLGHELETLASSLFDDFLPPGSGRAVGFYKLVLPDLEDESAFEQDLIPDGADPRDTFIGAAITAEGERGEFVERWESVFEFRGDGADWGIVALDQAVQSGPLLGTIEEAFNTTFEDVVQAPVAVPPDTGGSDGGTDGTTDGGTDGGTDGTDGSDGGDGGSPPTTEPPSPPPTVPPLLPPPPEDEPDELEPVIEPVADLVEDLLGGLLP